MKWTDVRQHFPHAWVMLGATQAHSVDNRRIVDELAVVDRYPDGQSAMQGYSELHRREPQRELYVLHTDREALEITELRWLGLREEYLAAHLHPGLTPLGYPEPPKGLRIRRCAPPSDPR